MSKETAMDKKIDLKDQLALEALTKKLIEKKEKKNQAKKKKVSIKNPSHKVETTWQSFAKTANDPPEIEKDDDSDTEFFPQKRKSKTDRPSKISKTSNEGGLSRIQRLEKMLSEQQESFKTLQSELQTHTEAIQGLMQVVSTPQNLANFQQQYAYSQLGTRSPNSATNPPTPQQVQYMPVFAYPQPMYYQQMQAQPGNPATPVAPPNTEQADGKKKSAAAESKKAD